MRINSSILVVLAVVIGALVMTVKSSKVRERRDVRFSSLEEMLEDAVQMSQVPVRTTGNWSQGQIYAHVADSLDISIDGAKVAPAPLRMLLTFFFKKRFLNQAIPAGFSAGSNVPEEIDVPPSLERLRQAVERQQREERRALHPGFGKITNQEWELFHLRHAELHFSFVLPAMQ